MLSKILTWAAILILASHIKKLTKGSIAMRTKQEELQEELTGLKTDVDAEKAQVAAKITALDARIQELEASAGGDNNLHQFIEQIQAIRGDVKAILADLPPPTEFPPLPEGENGEGEG